MKGKIQKICRKKIRKKLGYTSRKGNMKGEDKN